MRDFSTFAINLSFLIFLGGRGGAGAGSNLTAEQCLSIERVTTGRRSPKIVNAIENNPAYLHCAIGSQTESSEHLVAWTRLKDDALLTAGARAFTSDARFQISPKRHTRDWVLLIRRVHPSDEGCYLCEVNTEPFSTLVPVFLNVIPVQEIPKRLHTAGSKSTSVRNANLVTQMEGDSILLNCTISIKVSAALGLEAMTSSLTRMRRVHREKRKRAVVEDVLWTKDNVPIDINDGTKYASYASISPTGNIVHVLRILRISGYDDGLYACEGENQARATQMLHVNAAASAAAAAASGCSSIQFSPRNAFCHLIFYAFVSLILSYRYARLMK